MFNGFSHSVKGASHEARGLVCQDSSAHKVTDCYAAAVVADGHGSKKHFRSDVGSRCAVEAAVDTIARFYEDPEEFEKNFVLNHKRIIRSIEKQIIADWNVKVIRHLEKNPVTAAEKSKFTQEEFDEIPPESYYGTTLIAVVAGRGFTFGVQIGDGSLVAVFDDLDAVMPMEYEEANPANITASICNANAASMFESFYEDKKQLLALFASTDGLYTSFGSDNDFCDYHTILTSQLTNLSAFEPSVVKNLVKRSHFGTEDDISLSCVYCCEEVERRSDDVKQRVAQNKQRALERKAQLHKANI